MICTNPRCDGEETIDEDGYCTECGVKATLDTTSTTPVGAPRTTRTSRQRGTTRTTTSARHSLGAGLVEIPPVAEHNPLDAVVVDAFIPEAKRFCPNPSCGVPVGRSRFGDPGKTDAFCSKCGTAYKFSPALAPGEIVKGVYEVVGCLAHGGLGWVYLARDLSLAARWVALKGLLNAGDPDAIAAALAERRFLAEVNHPNVVTVYAFVEHNSAGYIVMEYVGGTSLRGLLDSQRNEHDGVPTPLPVAHAISYILEIVPAFAYLHGQGLMYCDFKPDNVMQTGRAVKLIDLGGVYRIAEPSNAIYGTRGFQAPEIAETGPTVPSDLYTIGRTLAVLCTPFVGYQQRHEFTLPSPDEEPTFAKYGSLYRFLLRATAPDPDDRFQSAEEFESQLYGVLREVVATDTGRASTATSAAFTPELRFDAVAPDWRALPALLVDTADPASGFLASLPAGTPAATIELLGAAPELTMEVRLRRVRELLDDERFGEARAEVTGMLDEDPWEWRARWYRALAGLAQSGLRGAIADLESVYDAVPGELAPKLALGAAHELAGNLAEAARWYDLVSRTDRSYTNAAFGLARCRLASGDLDGALDAYARIPDSASAHHAAQLATVGALVDGPTTPTVEQVRHAATVVATLRDGPERSGLTAQVLESALTLVTGNGTDDAPPTEAPVLGCVFEETSLRFGLEHAYRDFARFAPDTETRFARIDRANELRPRTLT